MNIYNLAQVPSLRVILKQSPSSGEVVLYHEVGNHVAWQTLCQSRRRSFCLLRREARSIRVAQGAPDIESLNARVPTRTLSADTGPSAVP